MSFHEKSNALMLGAIVLVYGVYFALVLGAPLLSGAGYNTEIGLPISNVLMIGTVIALVAIAIFGHIVIALLNHKEAGSEDERDKLIEMRGDQRGGLVLGFFAVGAMGLAMIATSHFWIVNTILGGLVAAEIVKAVSKLIDYRRGV
ncbi:hypothetical protein [Hyphobacterium indicum]|uniref:hypothetical protein n=1 Tax=Hyphobacterium indicum TaxID=2162714 RepID=UPI000F63F0BC|nr:hypothetical protein [Hyphobacterium indicum]